MSPFWTALPDYFPTAVKTEYDLNSYIRPKCFEFPFRRCGARLIFRRMCAVFVVGWRVVFAGLVEFPIWTFEAQKTVVNPSIVLKLVVTFL